METASINRTVRNGTGQAARCGSGKKGQAKVRTPRFGGHGFLRHRFEPMRGRDTLPYNRRNEARLLASFANLATLYGYTPLDVSGRAFPQNIAALHGQAVTAVAVKDRSIEVALLEDDGQIRLATLKEASTGTTLFYLPVYPLWRCLLNKQRKPECDLLLSVFAYLHQIAGIPFFNGWSYIGGKHQCLLEWVEESEADWEDADDWRQSLNRIKYAIHFGERMYRQVKHPYHLSVWGERLRIFKSGDDVAVTVWDIADRLHRLYQDYPTRSLVDQVRPELMRPNEECRMEMDQVFSFIWDENGWLGEQLFEMVSNELNECCAADEPVAIQYFDTPQSEAAHDLNFETGLYALLHDLSDVLRMMK